jgi:hypothetical protein
MGEIAAGGATIACALFAGAALYITLVEHPARPSCYHDRGRHATGGRREVPWET